MRTGVSVPSSTANIVGQGGVEMANRNDATANNASALLDAAGVPRLQHAKTAGHEKPSDVSAEAETGLSEGERAWLEESKSMKVMPLRASLYEFKGDATDNVGTNTEDQGTEEKKEGTSAEDADKDNPNGQSVYDDAIIRQVLRLNLMIIFNQWDSGKIGHLNLWEIQRGLFRAGHIFDSQRVHTAMELSVKGGGMDTVTIDEFSELIVNLCEGDLEMAKQIAEALAKQVPTEHSQNLQNPHSPRYLLRPRTRTNSVLLDLGHDLQNAVSSSSFLRRQWIRVRPLIPGLLALPLWVGSFALFYHFHDGFRSDRAFYYMVQSGLSIGFGALTENYYGGMSQYNSSAPGCHLNPGDEMTLEARDVSHFVTVINVLLGSSVIGGALSYFLQVRRYCPKTTCLLRSYLRQTT